MKRSKNLILQPTIKLVARPDFLGVPEEMGKPRKRNKKKGDQDVGTSGERLAETAGRVCYDSFGKGRDSHKYHSHIQEVGHGSIAEHSMWTFYIAGVSRGLTHELIRHRVGVGISQRSTRYVDEASSGYIVPPIFISNGKDSLDVFTLKEKSVGTIMYVRELAAAAYSSLVDNAMEILELTSSELSVTNKRKTARSAARTVLGQGLDVQMIWSANLRTLIHICLLRCTSHAEPEIRRFAYYIANIMKDEAPSYFGGVEFVECPDGLGPEISEGSLKRI